MKATPSMENEVLINDRKNTHCQNTKADNNLNSDIRTLFR